MRKTKPSGSRERQTTIANIDQCDQSAERLYANDLVSYAANFMPNRCFCPAPASVRLSSLPFPTQHQAVRLPFEQVLAVTPAPLRAGYV